MQLYSLTIMSSPQPENIYDYLGLNLNVLKNFVNEGGNLIDKVDDIS